MMNTFNNVAGLLAATAPSEGTSPVIVVLGMLLAIVVVTMFVTVVKRYKRCPSNKILVKYGKTGSGVAKCIHGGATFVWPLVQAYDYLDLEPFVVPIDLTNALSQENIRVTVPTTVTAAISTQPGIMENAAIRLLGETTQQIQTQAQDIIIGQMRAVIATMRIVDINRDRQSFMTKVNEAVAVELEKIGLAVINVNIRDIEDESGYIKAIGRQAAAEAINQANIDVAEQDKRGQTGVAERQRDQRVAVAAATAEAEIGEAQAARNRRQQVAAANAEAEIGEATAARNRRQQVAKLDAEAVNAETDANAKKAGYVATQRVAEAQARQSGEVAGKEADGAIRVAQEIAQKKAEDARAIREASRLNAEQVVPAEAEKKKVVIAAEAQKEQAINIAQGQAEAIFVKMSAEGKGTQAILEGKAAGYQRMVESCAKDPQAAAALLLIEKLAEVAAVQAKAIENIKFDKIIVWDTGGAGGGGGLTDFGRKLMGLIPPLHDLAKNVGLELPDFLGRMAKSAAEKAADAGAKAPGAEHPAAGREGKPAPKPDEGKA